MTTYTVLTEQSLLDVAVEVYGDASGVFWLVEDNPDVTNIADRIRVGQVLTIRADVVNPRQRTYLADFGPFQTIEEGDKPEGIGFWLIDEYTIE